MRRLISANRALSMEPTEDDQAIARRLDLVAVYLETARKPELADLVLDQPLGGMRERPLRLANADRKRAALGLTGFDQKLAKEMRFSRAAPTIDALVTGGREQRLKDFGCRDFQGGQ